MIHSIYSLFITGLLLSFVSPSTTFAAGVGHWKGYEQRGTDAKGRVCAVLNIAYSEQLYSWIPSAYPDVYSPLNITGPSIVYDSAGQPKYDFSKREIWPILVDAAVGSPIVIAGMQINGNSYPRSGDTRILPSGWSTRVTSFHQGRKIEYDMIFGSEGYVRKVIFRFPWKSQCTLTGSAFEAYRANGKGQPFWRARNSMFLWYRND